MSDTQRKFEGIVNDLIENKHTEVPVWRTQSVASKLLFCAADLAFNQTAIAPGVLKQAAQRLLAAADLEQNKDG